MEVERFVAGWFAVELLRWRSGLIMDRWERLILGLVVCAAGMGVAADASKAWA
jgi:hypothetical protein